MLIESLGIANDDFSKTAQCNYYIAQDFYLSTSLAIAVQVSFGGFVDEKNALLRVFNEITYSNSNY